MSGYILKIDTQDNKKTSVSLEINGKSKTKERKLDHASQNLLPLIDELLTENKLTLKMITAIDINTGPGSYTGLRVGMAVAQTLSFFLDIPLNGKKYPSYPDLVYNHSVNKP